MQRKDNLCRKGHDVSLPENCKRRTDGYIQCRQCERDSAKRRRQLLKDKIK